MNQTIEQQGTLTIALHIVTGADYRAKRVTLISVHRVTVEEARDRVEKFKALNEHIPFNHVTSTWTYRTEL